MRRLCRTSGTVLSYTERNTDADRNSTWSYSYKKPSSAGPWLKAEMGGTDVD